MDVHVLSARPSRRWARLALAAVAVAAVFSACAPPQLPGSGALALPGHVVVRSNGRIISVPLEDYVLGSALAEIVPVNESPHTVARIYEVQAVLARTYAAAQMGRHRSEGFDLCDTTHCQLYDPARIRTSRFAAAAAAAVRRTAGLVITYDHHPVDALFHADCGGYTDGADAIWGGPGVPYLIATPDTVPALTHHTWRLAVPVERLRAAFNADPRSQVGRRLDGVEVAARDVSGRATRVTLTGERRSTLRGEDLREIVDRTLGEMAIQSTRFTVARASAEYVFEGSGLGHGVGLCQLGALARARRGESLEHILDAYFRGVSLVPVRRTTN